MDDTSPFGAAAAAVVVASCHLLYLYTFDKCNIWRARSIARQLSLEQRQGARLKGYGAMAGESLVSRTRQHQHTTPQLPCLYIAICWVLTLALSHPLTPPPDTAVLLSVVTVNSKVFMLNVVPDTGKITASPPACGVYACSTSPALSEDDQASRMQRALAVVVDSGLFGDPPALLTSSLSARKKPGSGPLVVLSEGSSW